MASHEVVVAAKIIAGASLLALATERLPARLLLAFPFALSAGGLAGRLLLLLPVARLTDAGAARDRTYLLLGAGLAVALATVVLIRPTLSSEAPENPEPPAGLSPVAGARLTRLVVLFTAVGLGVALIGLPSLYRGREDWTRGLLDATGRWILPPIVTVILLGALLGMGAGLGRSLRVTALGTGLLLALGTALPAARPLVAGLCLSLGTLVASLVALRVASGLPHSGRLAAALAFAMLGWTLQVAVAVPHPSLGSGAAKAALVVFLAILALVLFLPDRLSRRVATAP